jgi:hypothetical protein
MKKIASPYEDMLDRLHVKAVAKLKEMNPDQPLAEKCAAIACVEGLRDELIAQHGEVPFAALFVMREWLEKYR